MNNNNKEIDSIISIVDLFDYEYQTRQYKEVILPAIFLKRLDSLLYYSKKEVLENYEKNLHHPDLDNLLKSLARDEEGNKLNFYNVSKLSFNEIANSQDLEKDLIEYISSFNDEILSIFEEFRFRENIDRLSRDKILKTVFDKINNFSLDLKSVSYEEMGIIFEKFLYGFSELLREDSEERFTSKDLIELMVSLVDENNSIKNKERIKVYDPSSSVGEILVWAKRQLSNDNRHVELFGQELNTFRLALSKAYMVLIGANPSQIKGPCSTLTDDQFKEEKFDYIISNLPQHHKWKVDEDIIFKESKSKDGRFKGGLPNRNDGQLLFIQHALSKIQSDGDSRIIIIANRFPSFYGTANSGESDIRKWIIENDYLETVIGLPGRLFYKTKAKYFLWILTGNKEEKKKGKIQLIDASKEFVKSPQKVGFKNIEFSKRNIENILKYYKNYENNNFSKIYDNEEFGFVEVPVERTIFKDKKSEKVEHVLNISEKIPLKEDLDEYFNREILEDFDDVSIDKSKAKVGYRINLLKCFYDYPESYYDKKKRKKKHFLKKLGYFAKLTPVENDSFNNLLIPNDPEKDAIFKIECNFIENEVKTHDMFECEVLDNRISPEYLKIYLNSKEGKYQRRLFSDNFTITSCDSMKNLEIPVPDKQAQRKIVSVDQKINEWHNESKLVLDSFNSKIFNYEKILEFLSQHGNIKETEEGERHLVYDELLWPLANAYLSATKGSSESVQKAFNYFTLFEFIAIFNSIVLLSALPKDIYEKEKNNIWHNEKSFKRVSFGKWVGLYRDIATVYQKNRDMPHPFSESLFNQITDKKIISIMNNIPQKRNDNVHGGQMLPIVAEQVIEELNPYLKDVFDILKSYNTLKLIYISSSKDIDDDENITYKVIWLNGACTPPYFKDFTTRRLLATGKLYLFNPATNEFLKLKDNLIKFKQCEQCMQWSLFVYNRFDEKNKRATYISYQSEQHDIVKDNMNFDDIVE